jgi:outer membrane receptor for ferrienterochelin and colicin
VVQRWRHTITWTGTGPFAASLSNTFSSGYEDQNSAINTDDGSVVKANRVKSYSLWDLTGAWQATKELKVRAGIQNLPIPRRRSPTRLTTSFPAMTRPTPTCAAAASLPV